MPPLKCLDDVCGSVYTQSFLDSMQQLLTSSLIPASHRLQISMTGLRMPKKLSILFLDLMKVEEAVDMVLGLLCELLERYTSSYIRLHIITFLCVEQSGSL